MKTGMTPLTDTVNYRILASALKIAGHSKTPDREAIMARAQSTQNGQLIQWAIEKANKDAQGFREMLSFYISELERQS